MVDAISKFGSVKPANLSSSQVEKNLSSNQNSPTGAKGIGEDKVDISPKRDIDLLRVEATILKNELPGIIANSLLQPLSGGAVSQDPLNSILSRLVNPAKSLLSSAGVDSFSKNQLSSFQSDIRQLNNEVSKMQSNVLLAPLNQSAERSNSLNRVLNSISNELTGLGNAIQTSL